MTNETLHKASDKLCQLSLKALANRLELDSRNALSEAESALREHYFYQLADELAALAASGHERRIAISIKGENPNEYGVQ